jgi:hypothetical protein
LLDVVRSQQSIGAAVDEKCDGGPYTPYYTDHHEANTKYSVFSSLSADDAKNEGEDRAFGEAQGQNAENNGCESGLVVDVLAGESGSEPRRGSLWKMSPIVPAR